VGLLVIISGIFISWMFLKSTRTTNKIAMIRKIISYIGMYTIYNCNAVKASLMRQKIISLQYFFSPCLNFLLYVVIKLFIVSFFCVDTGNEGQVATRSWVDMMKINLVHQPLDLSAYPALPGVQEIGKI